MKKVLIGVGVVAVVVIGAVAFLVGNLDSIIKDTVERVGSNATGAKVSLSGVEFSISDGRGALKGLTVGNPSGFKTDYAFDLGGVSVTVNTDQISGELVHIREITIDGPKLIYEVSGDSSNISTIQQNVDAYAAKFSGDGSSGASESSGGKGPQLIIDDVYIRDGNVNVSAPFLAGKSVGTALPDIHLEDIGKDANGTGGGASPAEVADRIITALTSQITASVSKLDIDGLLKTVNENALKSLQGASGQAEGMADEAGKAVEGAAEGIGDSINDLMGN